MSDKKVVLENFKKTTKNLDEILKLEKTNNVLYTSIKRFDLCFEMAYQLEKNIAKSKGLDCNSHDQCFKTKNGQWKNLIKDRKISYSITNDKQAEEIYLKLPAYLELFKKLLIEAEK